MRFGWVVALLAAQLARSEVTTGSFRVSPTNTEQRAHYITKFACNIGECRYKVRAGIKQPYLLVAQTAAKLGLGSPKPFYQRLQDSPPARLVVRVVLDDEWETSHHLSSCNRADLGRGRTTLEVPLNGTLGSELFFSTAST